MVPQTVSLFSGTLREKFVPGRPGSLRTGPLGSAGRRLAQGLGVGTTLGVGHRRGRRRPKTFWRPTAKIGIARALLCQAEYIVFDEATSSVDLESEQEIWRCIDSLAQTRTLIIISHRLSAIRGADNIYVLDRGQVAQQGTHTQLMAEPGLYRRLVQEQTLLEQQGEEGCTMAKSFHYSLGTMTRRLLKLAAPVKAGQALALSTLASVVGNLAQMGLMGFGALTLLACAGWLASPPRGGLQRGSAPLWLWYAGI